MIKPYPLRTEPFFRNYLWGGRKLHSILGKHIPKTGVWAESWEIIDHPEHQSRISNGSLAGSTLHDLAQDFPEWLWGEPNQSKQSLPLLLKYLDCQKVLSVQVHPDDAYAQEMSPPDLGKTEAWYIVSAEPGAKLYAGLKPGIDRQGIRDALANGRLENCLHELEPQAGDCIFIPAGTVHALGAGLLVAEIQQASNTTFRLFDWNRVDADGQPRELHIDQALQVIDFESGPRTPQIPTPTSQPGRERLVECEKFVLDRIHQIDEAQLGSDRKFHLLTIPRGEAELTWGEEQQQNTELLGLGQSILLPACMPTSKIRLASRETVVLDMYLP